MSSILLEPILPNLTKVSGSREQLRDLWRLFTKVKDCTQGGRRLENLYWRLWYQSSTTGSDQEVAKISSLLETWSHDSPSFKPSSSKLPSGASTLIEDHCMVPPENLREEVRERFSAPLAAELGAATTPMAPKDLEAAAPSSVSSVSSVSSHLPPPTPSITISRVGPSLRNLASSAANFEAPLAPRVSPAQKRVSSGGQPASATPPKVSMGFSFSKLEPAAASPSKPQASSSIAVSAAVLSPSPAAPRSTSLPEQAIAERSKPKKKFFITSPDSDDSSSEPEESYERPSRLPPVKPPSSPPSHLPHPQVATDPLTCTSAIAQSASPDPNATGIFCKVDPQGPDPARVSSKLSSLLKSPRRTVPVRPTHLLGSSNRQFFNPSNPPRRDDFLAGHCESESLRRGLQLDRKPLFDISLGLSASVASFATTPNVW